MRSTVFLFDIDGTLLLTGGAGRRAMAGAFVGLYGEGGRAAIDFSFGGMTDHGIVRTGLAALGASHDATSIDAVLEAYLGHLAREVSASDAYQVLPGVRAVLDWLASGVHDRTIAIGLGTGNVRRGAYTKLSRGALDGQFAFGGFGCDAEDRTALLRVGAERGAAALGRELSECRVVVIGDTPKDVSAAHAIGASCIAVGTGGFTPESLREVGAEHAFDTLADEGVREALFVDTPRAQIDTRARGV